MIVQKASNNFCIVFRVTGKRRRNFDTRACRHGVCRLTSFALLVLMILVACGFALAETPRTGQVSCYDQAGNVIDHKGTGQDGDIQAGAVWPIPRFDNNGDGTVTDRLTGLMWLKDGGCLGTMSWQAALEAGDKINSDGKSTDCTDLAVSYSDWTLPDIRQLESLFNGQEPGLSDWLNNQGFTNILAEGYWSRTTGPNPYSAWSFRFDTGGTEQRGTVEYLSVLLVRKAEAEDAPQAPKEAGSPPIDGRFQDNGDGTVTDLFTGLMWVQDAGCIEEGQWQEALATVKRFNENPVSFNCLGLTADYSDWAMPNRHELRSLIDHQADLPALPENAPFVKVEPMYWSSTTAASHPSRAYDVHVGAGDLGTSSKLARRGVWPVRPAAGRPERDRVLLEPPDSQAYSLLRPMGGFKKIAFPPQRFTDQGDGTLIDNITGLMWLKDADCFAPEKWDQAAVVVNWLNTVPERLTRKCTEYSARYDDWQLPDLDILSELAEATKQEPAMWLNNQGVDQLAARDYWTKTENPVNLYYSWAVNLRQGTARNYPKSFVLHFWPYRKPVGNGTIIPALHIKGNGKAENLTITPGTEFMLAVAVDNVRGVAPADFYIWYEAPDGTARWLTGDGKWVKEERLLYHGNLFTMPDHTVFGADTFGLKPGKYIFHFTVQTLPESDDSPVFYTTEFELHVSQEIAVR